MKSTEWYSMVNISEGEKEKILSHLRLIPNNPFSGVDPKNLEARFSMGELLLSPRFATIRENPIKICFPSEATNIIQKGKTFHFYHLGINYALSTKPYGGK